MPTLFNWCARHNNLDALILVHIREDAEVEPDHTVGLRLATLELRFDYMGTGVLMTRVSSLNVSLRDEWKLFASDKFNPTKRWVTVLPKDSNIFD